MAKTSSKILIVDDDADFASLLSDVFSQASFEVETLNDPTKADKLVAEKDFALVVTDLRMPGIDGVELSQRIRSVQPGLPIIVVSGYLDSKTREQMEKEGVVALYEKPLSVFSLLKNAQKLIAAGQKKSDLLPRGPTDAPKDSSDLGFAFDALPCKSEASRTFATALYDARERRSNLCVIAPRGVPARGIAENFCKWISTKNTTGRILEPKDCSEANLKLIIAKAAEAGLSDVTLLMTEIDQLDQGQQKQLARATRKGTFHDEWKGHVRLVFFVRSDLETLYQQGSLGDELYLSMGGGELTVPRLKDCSSDIRTLALGSRDEEGTGLEWGEEALRALMEREWPGNHAELRNVLQRLGKNASGRKITATDVIAAATEEESPASGSSGTRARSMRDILTECRASYLEAFHRMLGGDIQAVARMTHTSPEYIAAVLGLENNASVTNETAGKVRTRERERV